MAIQINELGFGREVDDQKRLHPSTEACGTTGEQTG